MKSCYSCQHRQERTGQEFVRWECRRFPPTSTGYPLLLDGMAPCGEHRYRESWWARMWPAVKSAASRICTEIKKLAKEMR